MWTDISLSRIKRLGCRESGQKQITRGQVAGKEYRQCLRHCSLRVRTLSSVQAKWIFHKSVGRLEACWDSVVSCNKLRQPEDLHTRLFPDSSTEVFVWLWGCEWHEVSRRQVIVSVNRREVTFGMTEVTFEMTSQILHSIVGPQMPTLQSFMWMLVPKASFPRCELIEKWN